MLENGIKREESAAALDVSSKPANSTPARAARFVSTVTPVRLVLDLQTDMHVFWDSGG